MLMLLAGCAQGPPRPVEIEAADTCASCRMAISEVRYAAELIDPERRLYKFDDIGCMTRFARDHRLIGGEGGRANVFVRDYDGSGWLEGGTARYVESPRIPSPMASGLIAVPDRQKAQQYANRFHGRVLDFAELWHR